MKKAFLLIPCLLFCAFSTVFAYDNSTEEPRFVIDMPTAGILHKGQMSIDAWMYRDGGMVLGINVGVFNRFMFGVSYGGNNVIGVGDMTGQKLPGINIKYRIIEESLLLPAFVLGFDTQGKEGYVASADRFVIKSPGLYVAASKNYAVLGWLSLHGCLNYTLENTDSRAPDFSVGAEKSIGDEFSIMASYDFGMNDHNTDFGKDRGYLNAGLRLILGGGLSIEADEKNILGNEQGIPAGNRTIHIDYAQSL